MKTIVNFECLVLSEAGERKLTEDRTPAACSLSRSDKKNPVYPACPVKAVLVFVSPGSK